MSVMYQVVSFGRGFGRHSGRWGRSVASTAVKSGDVDLATEAVSDEQDSK